MSKEYTQEIVCPYCEYEFGDSWEYDGRDGRKTNCPECDKTFHLTVNIEVTYSTYRGVKK